MQKCQAMRYRGAKGDLRMFDDEPSAWPRPGIIPTGVAATVQDYCWDKVALSPVSRETVPRWRTRPSEQSSSFRQRGPTATRPPCPRRLVNSRATRRENCWIGDGSAFQGAGTVGLGVSTGWADGNPSSLPASTRHFPGDTPRKLLDW